MLRKFVVTTLALALLAGCGIPEDEHNAVKKDLENTKMQLAETQAAKEKSETEMQAKIEGLDKNISELEKTKKFLEDQLAEANASLSMYESKTGGLQAALNSTKAELEELRAAKIKQERRLQEYRNLTKKLAAMVKSGKLNVKVRNGNMVIELPNDVLFDSGKTALKEDGKIALGELALVLNSMKDRKYLVAGHTDNVPTTKGSKYKSNWDLASARAVEVVKILQGAGVPPLQLAAAGYGEFDPVASNDDKASRALNRRIEIILMPNLDELPKLSKELFGQ